MHAPFLGLLLFYIGVKKGRRARGRGGADLKCGRHKKNKGDASLVVGQVASRERLAKCACVQQRWARGE